MNEKRFTFADGFKIVAIRDNGEIMNSIRVCDKLNELYEENRLLKEENEYLKPLANENSSYIDDMEDDIISFKQEIKKLKNENKELKERNNRQYKQLDDLYRLIEEKDWRALSNIMDDFKKAEDQLQKEWKCYE